jgi:ABC-2 type transport system permease protein
VSTQLTEDLGMVGRQVVAEQKNFWRNPTSAGFTFVFPIMFLVIFSTINSGAKLGQSFGKISYTEYYVPGILAFSVIAACFTNLAINLSRLRDDGVLKRKRGTPLPAWVLLGGMIANVIVIAIILSVITVGVGMAVYGNEAPRHVIWLVLSLALGAGTFCALGVAATGIIPNADAAAAVTNFLVFPLLFLSGTFFPVSSHVLTVISDVFPVRPFQQALFQSMDPQHNVGHPEWRYVAILAAWLIGGVTFAATTFRWEKRGT